MEMTKELMEKAKAAKTAEELMDLAKAQGVEMGKEEAEAAFAQLHKTGKLADEELDNVSGGGCAKGTESPYHVGEEVLVKYYDEWLDGKILHVQERGFTSWHEVLIYKTGEKIPWVCPGYLRKKY